MAKHQKFELSGNRKKLTTEKATKVAREKDTQNASFSLGVDDGTRGKLTGEVFEQGWKKGDSEGTMLLVEMAIGTTKKYVPFGTFRTKKRLGDDGATLEFEGAVPFNATFEDVLTFVETKADVIVNVKDYFRPGWSSPISVTTITAAE